MRLRAGELGILSVNVQACWGINLSRAFTEGVRRFPVWFRGLAACRTCCTAALKNRGFSFLVSRADGSHRIACRLYEDVPSNFYILLHCLPFQVAAQSKAWVCGGYLAGFAGSNPTGGVDVPHLWVLCCQVEFSASGWSLVQRSPTECGASECDREASIMRRTWPARGCWAVGERLFRLYCVNVLFWCTT
jgi:hypothetical protein